MASQPLCLVRSSINIDDTFSVAHIVRPGETISSSSLTSRAGGKGANVSAALGLAGANVHLCAAVATSDAWPVEELKKRGVDVECVLRLDDVPTGRAIIQIAEDGENSIVLLKGANFHATPQLSDPAAVFAALPRTPTHVVLQNEIPLSQTRAFLTHAHAQGSVTIFNPSPMPTQSELRAFEWAALDVLIVNEGEGADLLAALGEAASDTKDKDGESIIEALDSLAVFAKLKWLVMTRGAAGVLARVQLAAAQGGGKGDAKREHFSSAASKPRQVKDTTGAGDTFAGNLVAALMHAQAQRRSGDAEGVKRVDVERVLKWAGLAAAMAVEKDGAMDSIPKREDVQARIDEEK